MKHLAIVLVVLAVTLVACQSDDQPKESTSYVEWLFFCEQLLTDMEEAIAIHDVARTDAARAVANELYDLADEYYVKNGCPE